jgi:hypothetical protein
LNVGEDSIPQLGLTAVLIPLRATLAEELTRLGGPRQLAELCGVLLLDQGALAVQLSKGMDVGGGRL